MHGEKEDEHGDQATERQISVRGLKVWRIMGSIYSLLLWMIVIGSGVVVHIFDWPKWYVVVAGCLALILTVIEHLYSADNQMETLAI